MSEPQRRGRKYGSDYARAWARGLHFGDVRTKATLNAACNYVDEDGVCWPSIGTLADDTDQSEDSVRRRLVVLENLGVIARFPRWRDERGKVNYDGSGKRTTDEIRLMFNVGQDDIDAKNPDNSGGDDDAERPPVSPRQQQGLNPGSPGSEQGPSPRHQQGGRSHCSDPQDDPSLEEDSPQSPPLVETADVAVAVNTDTPYETFAEAYGEGSTRPQQARTLWDALTEDERSTAIRGARGYRAQRVGAKKPLLDPERFLRNRDLWTEFAPKGEALNVTFTFVRADSDEGKAWTGLHRIAGFSPSLTLQAGHEGYLLKGSLPPSALAIVAHVDERGSPMRKGWPFVEDGSQQFGAWRKFVGNIIGRSMHVRTEQFDVQEQTDGKGNLIARTYKTRRGARVPAPWPPRADGSWPEADALATEADLNEFSKTG